MAAWAAVAVAVACPGKSPAFAATAGTDIGTAAAAPVRRSSGSGSGPAVGGNLKHAVHEEAAAKLDGDEVDEGEWD